MSLVVLGERCRARLDGPLRALGLEPLYLPDNARLDRRLAGHADLSFFRAGERIWLSPQLKGTFIDEILRDLGYQVDFPNISEGNLYPADAGLNLCALGKRLIFSPKASSPDIVKSLTILGDYQPVPVKQGYIRCAALPVREDALITADPGIAASAEAAGLQVLRLCPGYVRLDGFAYGFLGGAGFPLDAGHMVFTGIPDGHPDWGRIRGFLADRGIRPLFLTRESIFDIGGAFVLEDLRPEHDGKAKPSSHS